MKRAVPILLCLVACSAKLDGSITIDGTKLDIQSCKSGQPMGFAGVELSDDKGTRLRLVANPDGTATAIVFAAGGDKGESQPDCGTLSVHPQNSKINNVTNVEGTAKISCGGAHRLDGSLEFENCH